MVYTFAQNSWLSELRHDAGRCVYALERDSNRGSTPAVFIDLSEGRDVGYRPLPRVRHFTPNRLQVDQALRRGWAGRPARSDAHAAQFSARNIGRDRERGPCAAE